MHGYVVDHGSIAPAIPGTIMHERTWPTRRHVQQEGMFEGRAKFNFRVRDCLDFRVHVMSPEFVSSSESWYIYA